MRDRRNNWFIVGLLAFVLVLSGAYALFATTLNIAGRAGGEADFRIEFTDHNISNEDKASVTLDSTNTTMNITADLNYPGDTVTINFTIENTGKLNSIVNNMVITENSNDDLNVNIVGLSDIKGTTLAPNDTTTGSIVITWSSASTNQTPESVDFTVSVDYLQST